MGTADEPFRRRRARAAAAATGFSLVELLVVVGIVAVMLAMLMPALAAARRQAMSVNCQANLRTTYVLMLAYANANRAWLVPPKLGTNVPRAERWPVHVFDPPAWNPRTLICPADADPTEEHSYILNGHVLERKVRADVSRAGGRPAYEIVLMGEKKSGWPDYYMEAEFGNASDFNRLVELYRHGLRLGSNYLMLDGSITPKGPADAASGFDPWDVAPPEPS